MKKLFLCLLLVLPLLAARAGTVRASFTKSGILVDLGDAGSFTITGPVLELKGGADGKEVSVQPAYEPAPDGLGGVIEFPKSAGDFKMDVKISASDNTIAFAFGQVAPGAQSLQFTAQFDAGQFRGGSYSLAGKPMTYIPIDPMQTESSQAGRLELVGRDGVGFSLKTPGGSQQLDDARKFNPGANTYTWNYRFPVDSLPAPTGFALSLEDLKVPITHPATILRPGPPPDGKWEPIPELTDDFKGSSLNAARWWDHNPHWVGRSPSYFAPNNVKVGDGKLQLLARLQDPPDTLPRWANFKNYSTACVVSKATVCYGYFEVKARPMNLNVCSAFWFYTTMPTPYSDHHVEEIDVFEMDGGGKKYERALFNTVHVWRTPEKGDSDPWAIGVQWRAPSRLADDYHIYSMEWDKDEIKTYFDGYLYARFPNTNWHYPMNILFDNEIQGPWFGVPPAQNFSGTFDIAYIHSWRRSDQPNPPAPASGAK